MVFPIGGPVSGGTVQSTGGLVHSATQAASQISTETTALTHHAALLAQHGAASAKTLAAKADKSSIGQHADKLVHAWWHDVANAFISFGKKFMTVVHHHTAASVAGLFAGPAAPVAIAAAVVASVAGVWGVKKAVSAIADKKAEKVGSSSHVENNAIMPSVDAPRPTPEGRGAREEQLAR